MTMTMNHKVKFKFTVFGDPRGKGRPRFFKGHAYTDKATTEYEERVRRIWNNEQFYCLPKIPTTVIIDAYFKVPASLSKKKRDELFGMPYLKKPDADNIGKIILDALSNGLAYVDDAQIDAVCVTKRYVKTDDEEPRVEITVVGGEK